MSNTLQKSVMSSESGVRTRSFDANQGLKIWPTLVEYGCRLRNSLHCSLLARLTFQASQFKLKF